MAWFKRYNSAYHIISLAKMLVGLGILVVVYQYIDPFQDPETWIIIWSVWLLFFIRGFSYFVFYAAGLRRSDNKVKLIMSHAYKLSLLVALFFLTNIVFLVIEFWSFTNSLITVIIFWSIYRVLFHRPLPEQHTSIDMIIGEGERKGKRIKEKDEE